MTIGADNECPACGNAEYHTLFEGTDRLFATTTKRFSVVRCSECDLLRLHPWPAPDELKTYYPKNYWLAGDSGSADRLADMYRRLVLRDHLSFVAAALRRLEPGPLLDVGCGGALFGRMLRESGYSVFGLDFSDQAARVGWKTNGVPVAVADFATAPLRPGSFAAITMFHVLEHLYDPVAYVTAAREYLRAGGSLIVQVPNASSWQFRLFGRHWNGVDVPRHLINFRARDLDKLLESCGFEILRHKHFSLRDNPAGFVSSIAPALDPMGRRVRGADGSDRSRLVKDLAYFCLVLGAVPLTALEAACGAGSSVMVEARKRA